MMVTVLLPDTPAEDADMVAEPPDTPVTIPPVLTVATEVALLVHVTLAVKSRVVLSE
jgi:hypothetical protein